ARHRARAGDPVVEGEDDLVADAQARQPPADGGIDVVDPEVTVVGLDQDLGRGRIGGDDDAAHLRAPERPGVHPGLLPQARAARGQKGYGNDDAERLSHELTLPWGWPQRCGPPISTVANFVPAMAARGHFSGNAARPAW